MTEIRIFQGQRLLDSDLPKRIIEFDKQNMAATLEAAGSVFPEENRLKTFQSNPTLIVAFHGEQIAGYIEYLRSWNDARYIYVSSLQIATAYRNSKVLLKLLVEFIDLMHHETFAGFETSVQKVNQPAVKLCRKLGFVLAQNPRNETSWIGRAGPELLQNQKLIRWKTSIKPQG